MIIAGEVHNLFIACIIEILKLLKGQNKKETATSIYISVFSQRSYHA